MRYVRHRRSNVNVPEPRRAEAGHCRRVRLASASSFFCLCLWVLGVGAVFCLSVLFIAIAVVSSYRGRLPFGVGGGPPGLIVGTLVGTRDASGLLFLGFADGRGDARMRGMAMRMHVGNRLGRDLHPLPPRARNGPRYEFNVASQFAPKSTIHVSTVASSKRCRT